jgi:hypothetical protein
MAPILPVMKFAEVALKQIAKPVSKQLLDGALAYPQVTKFCVTIGQTLHYINVRVTRSAEGQSNSRKVFELPEDKAKDAGALFLGEMIVFGLTGLIIAWQYYVISKAGADDLLAQERQILLHEAEKHAELQQRDMRLAHLEESVGEIWKLLDSIKHPQYVHDRRSGSSAGVPSTAQSDPAVEDAVDRLMKISMSTQFVE